jgi:hypothetical protein
LAPFSGVDEGLCRSKGDHSARDGRGSFLLGGAMPDMRERLIQRVEAALRSEG